jgi:1-acyl-sn-glycerol-3-phosphate acyltransferase
MSVRNNGFLNTNLSKYLILAIWTLVGLSLLYTIILAQPILPVLVAWAGIILSLVLMYLFFRVVLAIEKIAESME